MKGFLGAPVLTEANNTRTVHEKRPTNRPTERPFGCFLVLQRQGATSSLTPSLWKAHLRSRRHPRSGNEQDTR
uniref:Uncharacterized protein n=1 Tax=Siphoviridae sp. ctCCv12 TaxID=2826191 RepID=A0A8S5N6W9_9CAUD|nr:MAG TPA: hypothetical protein [Siphoviridae sp. ctCCv12]